MSGNQQHQNKTKIVFYYKGQLTSNHKIEEKRLVKIVSDSSQPKDPQSEINLRIYYKNFKLANVVKTKVDKLSSSHNVVYRYTCTESSCNRADYIGYTTNELKTRSKQHENNGAIKNHFMDEHKRKPHNIMQDMKILARFPDANTLQIAEAILIKEESPSMNRKDKGLTRHLNIIWIFYFI